MLDEPVRGAVPDRSLFSLSGIEQLRALMRGLVPAIPVAMLVDATVTEVSSGSVAARQILSPWFDSGEGTVQLTPLAESGIWCAALTGAPAATEARTANLSVRYLRPCTVDSRHVLLRGRILHAGSAFTTAEALIEDSLGRAVVHATGSVVLRPIVPEPPPLAAPLRKVEEPVYATPAPCRRPVPLGWGRWRDAARERAGAGPSVESGEPFPLPPVAQFLGARVLDISPGGARVAVRASEWFSSVYGSASAGLIGAIGEVAIGLALATVAGTDDRISVNQVAQSFLAPVLPVGQELTAVATLRHRGDVHVMEAEVSEPDGRTVAIVQMTCLLRAGESGRPARPAERLLLTVLFTDLVRSTELAGRLGPVRWRQVLEEHHALVRRQLELHRGREVKCTGDGFLATFDSPSRAVACARAVRDGLDRLDLPVRIGIHAGECEVMGADVGGLAVHIASRIEAAAAPGEILVSSTVHDMLVGSGLCFVDQGRHALKGIDGEHHLFAVAESADPAGP